MDSQEPTRRCKFCKRTLPLSAFWKGQRRCRECFGYKGTGSPWSKWHGPQPNRLQEERMRLEGDRE